MNVSHVGKAIEYSALEDTLEDLMRKLKKPTKQNRISFQLISKYFPLDQLQKESNHFYNPFS